MPYEARFKKNKNSNKFYTKTRQIRMIKLTDSYIKTLEKQKNEISLVDDEMLVDYDDTEENTISNQLGTAQSFTKTMYSQIFEKIEEYGKEGVALKQIGHLFALDFYRSRRMGANLQTHPEILTLIKETNRGKAKYQTISLRKFQNTPAESLQNNNNNNLESEELTIQRREGQTNKNIQAIMSNRTLSRKKIVQSYLEKNRICTKYEITREIRSQEQELGLKGLIDSKTTKRMLTTLENENKLKVFYVNLKNLNYMCARAVDITEEDEVYKNYCATFKRTFDSVNLNLDENENEQLDQSQEKESLDFKLTRSFINSSVANLKFSTNFSKVYALVPKFQKAIVLHRYLHYLLYFYNGKQQSNNKTGLNNFKFNHSTFC